MPVTVDTSGRIYDDFSRLLFLHTHREASALANELPGESVIVASPTTHWIPPSFYILTVHHDTIYILSLVGMYYLGTCVYVCMRMEGRATIFSYLE